MLLLGHYVSIIKCLRNQVSHELVQESKAVCAHNADKKLAAAALIAAAAIVVLVIIKHIIFCYIVFVFFFLQVLVCRCLFYFLL